MRPLAVLASGMTTAVGLNSASTCAAVRCAIGGAQETAFMDGGGEWILGCSTPVDGHPRGLDKLVRMAASAISECVAAAGLPFAKIPVAFCVAEKERAGRVSDLEAALPKAVATALKGDLHPDSIVISRGRVGLAHALKWAEAQIHDRKAPACILAGADSMLIGATLRSFEQDRRLLTSVNSNGFIPGDAAGAVLVGPVRKGHRDLVCRGVAFETERATVLSGEPLRADALAQAYRAALADAGCTYEDVQYRLADVSGEQYGMKEAQLAIGRTLRGKMKPQFPIWHPADCIGEVGAAIGPCLLGVALAALQKGYAPGSGAIGHLGSDGGERAAFVLRTEEGGR